MSLTSHSHSPDSDEQRAIAFELAQLKRRKIALLQEKLALKKDFGLMFYRPHPKQDRFHRAGKFKRRYLRAGNRFGKSDMGVAEDCAWLLGYRPWYAESDPARYEGLPNRPVKGLVIAADWDKVREIFTEDKGERIGKFFRFLPKDVIKSCRRTATGVINWIELTNGSTISFDTVKAYITNPMGGESSDWDFVHVDEPCPEKMFRAAARGLLDRDGASWFTLTPLSEPWIDDMFFPDIKHQMSNGVDAERVDDERRIFAIQGSMRDNPYLSEIAINEYLDTLPPEERECREKGIPLERAGRIYKDFKYDVHVLSEVPRGWESYNNPPSDYSIYYAIDPHPQTPHAVLFLAVAPTGELFFYDEVFEHTSLKPIPTWTHKPSLSQMIWQRILGRNLIYGICDPLGFITTPVTMTSMVDDLNETGLLPRPATKDPCRGILRVQEALCRKNYIYVSPHLTRFLYEIERYHWDQKRPDKPVDKDDHMMEDFYRLILENPVYVPKEDPYNRPVEDIEIVGNHSFSKELTDRSI
jgi:hypothetical protein